MEVIRPNDYVLIRMPSENVKMVQMTPDTTISLGKFGSFPANSLLGRPYHLTWDILDGTGFGLRHVKTEELIRDQLAGGPVSSALDKSEDTQNGDDTEGTVSPAMVLEDTAIPVQIESEGELVMPEDEIQAWSKEMKNNREIRDDQGAQTMTWKQIEEFKKSGDTGSGKDIINKLLSSHTHIEKKTAFSLAKYTLRKAQKYLKRFTVLPIDSVNLTNYLLTEKEPLKMKEIRDELLGLAMSWADIKWGGRWLVIDETGGLILAAVAERMGLLPKVVEPVTVQTNGPHKRKRNEGNNESVPNMGEEDIDLPQGRRTKVDQNITNLKLDATITTSTKQGVSGLVESNQSHRDITKNAPKPLQPVSRKIPPVPEHNTITFLHTADQPNTSHLKAFQFDLSSPQTCATHPLNSHLLTLSYLQLLSPELDPTLFPPPETFPDEEIQTWKANKRTTYYRRLRKWERSMKIVSDTRSGGFDGVVIATGMELSGVLNAVVPLLRGSGQLVMYSPHVEPMAEVADWYNTIRRTEFMKRKSQAMDVDVETTSGDQYNNLLPAFSPHKATKDFPVDPSLLLAPTIHTSRVRRFQALPSRTHPLMTSRGGSEGYVLHATKVLPILDDEVKARGKFSKRKKLLSAVDSSAEAESIAVDAQTP